MADTRMTRALFRNIEPRYRHDEHNGSEARWQEALQTVGEAMDRTFGPERKGPPSDDLLLLMNVSNGTPRDGQRVNTDGPGMKEAWRRRMEKAKREIAEHREHIRTLQRERVAQAKHNSEKG